MANMRAMTGHLHDASRHPQEDYNKRTQLNPYIYEYFLRNGMFQCAQSILEADSDVRVQKHSPGSARDDKGCRLENDLFSETIDTGLDSTLSKLLPTPNVPNLSSDTCFLYEWFCIFWAMFNAQRNEDARTEANQYASHIQQQNWPGWNASRSQTQSSLRLLHTPDSATHNDFYNSDEMGGGSTTPWTSGVQNCGRRNGALQKFQLQLASMEQRNQNELTARQGRSGLSQHGGAPGAWASQGPLEGSKLFQWLDLQTTKPEPLPTTTKEMKLGTQQMTNTGIFSHPLETSCLAASLTPSVSLPKSLTHIELDLSKAGIGGIGGNAGSVQTNDWTRASDLHTCQQSNDQTNRQPMAAKETQFQQQEKTGRNGLVQWQKNPSEKQISRTAPRGGQGTLQERFRRSSVKPVHLYDSAEPRSTILSPPQTSKSARGKGPYPKRTTSKKSTKGVKNKMATRKIPRLNVGFAATHPVKTATNPVPPINPVGLKKDTQNTSLVQVVPTGQPAVPLSLMPASMAANSPVNLVQSATFSMENSNVTDFASLPTFKGDFHDFDIDAFLESYSEDASRFSLEPFSVW